MKTRTVTTLLALARACENKRVALRREPDAAEVVRKIEELEETITAALAARAAGSR